MPYYEFLWTDEAIEHLVDNDITPEEFEEVVSRPTRIDRSHSSGLPAGVGYANDGRLIFCVYDSIDVLHILPVTAFYLERRE